MLGRVITHLERLVSCDTQNPPRAITASHHAIAYCAEVLRDAGCEAEIVDLGGGSVTLHAVRGEPTTIVNCHLDTVPADPSWTHDPFKLAVERDVAVGLGACDVKGAASCMLAAIEDSEGPVGLLLTTDEEAGKSICVREFLGRNNRPYTRAIVAEPTGVRAVTKHRGLATYDLRFEGVAAHSSVMGANQRNAVHQATAWCAKALDAATQDPWDNVRLNIGVINGGTKANVAASSCSVVYGVRPPPGLHPETVAEMLDGLASPNASFERTARFCAPGLDELPGTDAMIAELGLERGEPVDFWTEAALFGEAGLQTIVLGPGNIKQAHAADEFVPLEDLRRAAGAYRAVFSGEGQVVEPKGAAGKAASR